MDKIELLKKADKIIGTPLCYFFGLINSLYRLFVRLPAFNKDDVKKILFIKTIAIGDVMLTLPAVRAVKEAYPAAELYYLAFPRVREVLDGYPYLDRVIYFDPIKGPGGIFGLFEIIRILRSRRFDLIIEFEHYYRFTTLIAFFSGARWRFGFDLPYQGRQMLFTQKVPYPVEKHESEAFMALAKAAGAQAMEIRPERIEVSDADRQAATGFLIENSLIGKGKPVIIHPGTGRSAKSRRWLPERWAELADWLQTELRTPVIISGTSEDEEVVKEIVSRMKTKPFLLAGRLDLKGFAALVEAARLFIGVDTGPLHVAAATGVRVIGLYGPNTPVKWGPYGKGNISLYRGINCSPCTRQYLGQVSKCEKDDCMRAISLEDVKEAVMKLTVNG